MAYRVYKSRAEMTEAGWRFSSEPQITQCRNCHAPVEWSRSPRDRNVPLNAGTCVVHFESCGSRLPALPAPAPQQLTAPMPPVPGAELIVALHALGMSIDALTRQLAVRQPQQAATAPASAPPPAPPAPPRATTDYQRPAASPPRGTQTPARPAPGSSRTGDGVRDVF
jgi:hypothetical protein